MTTLHPIAVDIDALKAEIANCKKKVAEAERWLHCKQMELSDRRQEIIEKLGIPATA
jgi:hypothetical protein